MDINDLLLGCINVHLREFMSINVPLYSTGIVGGVVHNGNGLIGRGHQELQRLDVFR